MNMRDIWRVFMPELYREMVRAEEPEDYPPDTDWRPADDLLSSTPKN
jgi:hypothetical protein